MSIALMIPSIAASVIENNRIVHVAASVTRSDYDAFTLSPEEEAFYSAEAARYDQRAEEAKADEVMDRLYARLERPRKRRQAPLPTHHYKTWGHGNAKVMIDSLNQYRHDDLRKASFDYFKISM